MNSNHQNRKRILIITPFCRPSVGGAETHLDDFCEYLRTHGFYVYVLTYQPITLKAKGLSFEKKENLEIRRFSWIGGNLFYKLEKFPPIFNFLYLTPYLFFRSFIFMFTRFEEIDIIHAQGLNSAFIAMILGNLFHKKTYLSTMALYSFKPGTIFSRVTAFVLRNLNAIFAESPESKAELVKISVPDKKIIIFSHWVNQDIFKPVEKNLAKKLLGWENKFIALFVGRAIPIKGGDTLVEVVKNLNPKINLAVISAAGPLIPKFKRTAKKYKNFLFIGGISYEDLYRYYQAADLFIIPSRYEEGAARVVMEAVSCGLPVIAANRGALPGMLNPKIALIINPVENQILESLQKLCKNPKLLTAMASRCFQFSRKYYSSENAKVITDSYI